MVSNKIKIKVVIIGIEKADSFCRRMWKKKNQKHTTYGNYVVNFNSTACISVIDRNKQN